jgi:hypothetical protein
MDRALPQYLDDIAGKHDSMQPEPVDRYSRPLPATQTLRELAASAGELPMSVFAQQRSKM